MTRRNCPGADITFTWSAENRLTSVNLNGGNWTADLHYDATGRLVHTSTNQANSSRFYIWDGDVLLAEISGDNGATVAEYSWYGPDKPHAVRRAGVTYWAHVDALGNVIAWTQASDKSVARTYAYDPWGNVIATSGSLVDGVRWKGAWAPFFGQAAAADLHYLRARWYEGMTGRFLSEDPIGLAGGINPYQFTNGDPVNGRDPSGLDRECIVFWSYWKETGEFHRIDWITCPPNLTKNDWGDDQVDDEVAQAPPGLRVCVGRARVLQGNTALVGREGGFPRVRVQMGTAAIDPFQFGGSKSALAPHLGSISGTVGGQFLFAGVTDVIGNTRIPPGYQNIREYLRARYPNVLLLEIVGSRDLGIVDVTITMPAVLNCPMGTTQQ